MGTLVAFDRRSRDRREVPAYRLAETGMEVQSRAQEVRRAVEEISRHAWAGRDPWTLAKISRLLPSLAALDIEGKRIASWSDGEAECADGLATPGHGLAAGE